MAGWWQVTLPDISYIDHIDIYNVLNPNSKYRPNLMSCLVFLDGILLEQLPGIRQEMYTVSIKKYGNYIFNNLMYIINIKRTIILTNHIHS